MAATVFVDKLSRLCGSRRLAWLLLINIVAAGTLWISMLTLHMCRVDTDILYSLFALPSGMSAFLNHPWTLATYMFVHFSPLHLLFNMLWLFWFGRMLADIEHDRTITTIFTAGGLTGGMAYLMASALTGYDHGSSLAGASAAVLCLMCATAVRMPDRKTGLFLIGEVKLKWVAAACVLLTLLGGASSIPTQCAHLAGVCTGIASKWAASKISGFATTNRHKHSKNSSNRHHMNNARNVCKSMPTQQELNDRLDMLLDKIRLSGFESLSEREKSELDYLSTVIDKTTG